MTRWLILLVVMCGFTSAWAQRSAYAVPRLPSVASVQMGQESFLRTVNPQTVTLNPSTVLYSRAREARNPDLVRNPGANPRACVVAGSEPVTGNLLHTDRENNLAIVELNYDSSTCPNFEGSRTLGQKVFVRLSDVQMTPPQSSSSQTEATFSPRATCANCDTPHANNVLNATMVSQEDPELHTPPKRKPMLEVNYFVRCYTAPDERRMYDLVYQQLINLTLSTMHSEYREDRSERCANQPPVVVSPSPQFMACNILAESHYRNSAVSETGARGLVQSTSVYIEQINRLISEPSSRSRGGSNPNAWARPAWQNFVERALRSITPEQKALLDPLCKHLNRPACKWYDCRDTVYTNDHATCPVYSIASLALYQVYLQRTIRRSMESENPHRCSSQDYGHPQEHAILMFASTSHNAGETAAARIARGLQPTELYQSFQNYLRTVPSNRSVELNGYHTKVENCISPDQWRMQGERRSCNPPQQSPTRWNPSPVLLTPGAR